MSSASHVNAEVHRWRQRLKALLVERGRSIRSVEQEMGWGNGYLGQILRGSPEIRVRHVLEVLAALDVPPKEFFGGLYGTRPTLLAPERERLESGEPMGFEELWGLVTRLVQSAEPDNEEDGG